MPNASIHDAIVIGGGLVGAAIAYGLTHHRLKPVLLDEGDVAFRAARGNFGLVWVQSKGAGVPEYQCWSRLSSELWTDFAAELKEAGGLLLGDSYEEAGYDDFTSLMPLRDIAARAVRTFPFLRDINVVRTWAALRVMSPDGLPIYEQSREFPGAFIATCHSGVTLAAAHAVRYAQYVADGKLPPELARFAAFRFHVPKAA